MPDAACGKQRIKCGSVPALFCSVSSQRAAVCRLAAGRQLSSAWWEKVIRLLSYVLLLCPVSLTLKGAPSLVPQVAQSWKFEQIPRSRMALVRLPGRAPSDPAPEDDTGKAKQALPRWAKATAGPSAARPPLPASVTADKHARCTVIDDALPLFQSEARQIGRQQAQVGRQRTKGCFLGTNAVPTSSRITALIRDHSHSNHQVRKEGGSEAAQELHYLQAAADLLGHQAARTAIFTEQMRSGGPAVSGANRPESGTLRARVIEAIQQARGLLCTA